MPFWFLIDNYNYWLEILSGYYYLYWMENIPIHNFSKDDESSIAFDLVPLENKSNYDSSIPHRHNYYEIFVFEQGGGEHDIDFNTFDVKDHSVHFVSPGQVHNLRRKAGSYGSAILFSREFYSINLQNQEVLFELPFLNNNSNNPILNLDQEEYLHFKELTHKMQREHFADSDWKADLIRSFLNAFLIYSKRHFNKMQFQPFMEDSIVFEFRKLIEKHFHRLHKVSEYAELMNVSEKQLNAHVKSRIGSPPSEMIYGRIVLEAKRLVLYSDYTFQEIAYFLNYCDPSHFAKFFRSKTGFSPGNFRKRGIVPD